MTNPPPAPVTAAFPEVCSACGSRATLFSGDTAHYECHASYSVSFGKFINACFVAHGNYPVLLAEVARLQGERDAAQSYSRDIGNRYKELSDENAETREHNTRMAQQVNALTAELTALRERLERVTVAAQGASKLLEFISDYQIDESIRDNVRATRMVSVTDIVKAQAAHDLLIAYLTAPAPVAQAGGEKGE